MKKNCMLILILGLLSTALILAVIRYPFEVASYGFIVLAFISMCFLIDSIINCSVKSNKPQIELNTEWEFEGKKYYIMSSDYKKNMDSLLNYNEEFVGILKETVENVKDSNLKCIATMEHQQTMLENLLNLEKRHLDQIDELKEENKALREEFQQRTFRDSAPLQTVVENNEFTTSVDASDLAEKPKEAIWIGYELLGTNLYQTGLMQRTVDLLLASGITKVGELISHTREEISLINNLGEKKLRNIDDFLNTVHLSYGMEVKEEKGKWFIKTATE